MKPFNRITCPATAVATGLLATLFLLASCSRDENDASGSEIRARLTVSTVAIAAGGVSTNTRVPVLPPPSPQEHWGWVSVLPTATPLRRDWYIPIATAHGHPLLHPWY